MRILLFLPILFSFNAMFAQWTAKNVFEPKVFVENKGQFKVDRSISSEEVLFGARQDGMHYYFTRDAILIKRVEMVKNENEEQELPEFRSKPVENWHVMKFDGAALSAKIESNLPAEAKHHYGTPDNQTIVANAFKKIVYKGLYPNIDMEFEFPSDRQGFKYSFIVHPGGDASQIDIQYPLAKGVKLQDGNMVISSAMGEFVDHTPVSFQNGNAISSSFANGKRNRVSFNLGSYDKTNEVIVDPWTSTPTFTGGNNAYDVDWDNAGNCYVYGGTAPFQVIKFNSTGTVQWTYTSGFSSPWYYGDFAVDRNSGSVYVIDGFNSSGAQIIKVNSSGTQVAINQGNSLMQELWRVVFDPCSQKVVIGGGGTSNPTYTGCVIDTNLTTGNFIDVINCPTGLHDMWSVAIDGMGGAYFATAKTQVGTAGYDNNIYKVPMTALTPITWQTPEGFLFTEVASVNYAPGPPNGFNGMVVNDTNLFLYDSYVLKRFLNSNGALTATLSVNGTSQSTMTSGGLASDGCGNLYAGLNNTVKQYDANLNFSTSYPMPSNVYDVATGNGMLYACGMGFVSATSVGGSLCYSCQGGSLDVPSRMPVETKLYPNPATNELFVELPADASIRLVNDLGQTVKESTLMTGKNRLLLQNLPAGVYSAIIRSENKQLVRVLVKSNP